MGTIGTNALVNGVNGLSISTDIQFGDTNSSHYNSYTNGVAFSNTPSSIRSESPSQMSSTTSGNNNLINPPPEPLPLPSLQQHLADSGLHNPRFPDVTIHLANFPPISAHAIFLSRSPYLNSLLLNQPPSPPYTVNLPVSDPNLTYDALLNTLGYLYSFSSQIPSPDANSILAHISASCALGIFPPDLVQSYRQILLKANLTPSTIHTFLSFLLSTTHHPLDPTNLHPGQYPPFTTGLLTNVIDYFLTELPLHLQSSSTSSSAGGIPALPASANTEEYKEMLTPLPFEILKAILEHPSLPIRSEKQRYELAKSIVSKRSAKEKATRKRTESGNSPVVEESVILKVGGEGDGVTLVRSYNRRRLWKAQSTATITAEGRRSRNSTTGSK